jgi:myo-inositol-1(or 4)-monophosphatase
MLTIAVRAARRAGRLINVASNDLEKIAVSVKQQNDFVTEVDRAAEKEIIDVLLGSYPKHSILGEETGGERGAPYTDPKAADNLWIIDPLDGTTNFIHGMPQYAVSIALMQRNVVTQAVVYDPSRDELYTASRGGGAFLNNRRLRVSKRTRIEDALVGTGFPFRKLDLLDDYLRMLRTVTQTCAGVRRPGAAALDLAYVAAGRYDAFFELGLMPWDAAAGSLLIQEAGGMVGDLSGEADFLFSEQILAATPKLFTPFMALINPSAAARRPGAGRQSRPTITRGRASA